MEWRRVTSRYHGSKISGSLQSFLKEKGICISERWKNSMEYRFCLECSQAQESHTFQSSAVCSNPEILLLWQRDVTTSPFYY